MKKYLILLSAFILCGQAVAQQNIGLHFTDVWQQNRTNPAFFSDQKLTIGLTSFYNNSLVEGVTLSEVIREENGQNILDIDAAIAGMGEENDLQQFFVLETVNVGLNLGKIGLSLSHALKFDAVYTYPKSFAQVIFQGNAQFVGQTAELGSRIDFKTYNEIALGAAYQTEKFSIGGRAKYLVGAGSAVTNPDRRSASVYTDPDIYQLTLTTDYELRTAAFVDFNDFDDIQFDYSPSTEDIQFGGGNTGFAFDLGAAADLGKLHLAASVLDLGGVITWEEDATAYSTNGTFTYEGLDISDALSGEAVDFASALDTLQQIFGIQESNTEFETDLATQAYVSARYDLTEKLTLGALYYGRFADIKSRSAVALSGQYKLADNISAGATYAVIDDTFTNLGLNGAVTLGPVQIYAVTDNVFGLISQKDGENVNFRFGLNLLLGKKTD